MVYKWMDGTTLSWGSFYNSPWKDSSTPVNDVTKACVKMEWGAGLLWKHHDCSSTVFCLDSPLQETTDHGDVQRRVHLQYDSGKTRRSRRSYLFSNKV